MTREKVVEKLRAALKSDPRRSPEIAALLGWHPVSVRNFKSGAKGIGLEEMESLAEILGFKIEWELKNDRKS